MQAESMSACDDNDNRENNLPNLNEDDAEDLGYSYYSDSSTTDDSSVEANENVNDDNLCQDIAAWATEHKNTRAALNDSSNTQFWPILCSVDNFKPFIVALFCGIGKPNSVQEYLSEFLEELQNLLANGISYEEKNGEVKVQAFVCDAPARTFLKCTIAHNGYYGCERCTIKGTWMGRVVFNITDINNLSSMFQSQFEQSCNSSFCCHTENCFIPKVTCDMAWVISYSALL
ncbi:unnamed protein product [Mytilus coruscus]|uniref:Transposase domain-containing protein n=1 Tax=Mytilus coruscus TaxID=42192 RepID=A0A6J8EUC9_MYTCO|nr:unnamed protein product [Mytilus coruscus]